MGLDREKSEKEMEKNEKITIEEEFERITSEKLEKMIERMIEEKIEELIEERIGRRIERNLEGFRIGAGGKKMMIRRFAHPVPIRNLDKDLYMRMRRVAARKGVPVGQLINEAMKYYLENYDKLSLKRRKLKILRRLQEIGSPGALDPEVRDILKKELEEELDRVNKRLEDIENQ